jgi:hypothetical protein
MYTSVSTLRHSELQVCKLHYAHDAGPSFACLDSARTTSSNTDMIKFCAQCLVRGRSSGCPHSMSHELVHPGSWSRIPCLLSWKRVLELTAPEFKWAQLRPHVSHKCTQARSDQPRINKETDWSPPRVPNGVLGSVSETGLSLLTVLPLGNNLKHHVLTV